MSTPTPRRKFILALAGLGAAAGVPIVLTREEAFSPAPRSKRRLRGRHALLLSIVKQELPGIELPDPDAKQFVRDFFRYRRTWYSEAKAHKDIDPDAPCSLDDATLDPDLYKLKQEVVEALLLSSNFFSSNDNLGQSPKSIRYIQWFQRRVCTNPFATLEHLVRPSKDPSSPMAPAERLYHDQGCFACHGSKREGGVGPKLTGLDQTEATLADGTTVTRDRSYMQRALTTPDSEKLKGYANSSMPSYKNSLSESERKTLIDWLLTEPQG